MPGSMRPKHEESTVTRNSSTQAQPRLPHGWEWVTAPEITEFIRGVSYKKGDATEMPKEDHLPILRATNIQDDRLITDADLVFVPRRYVKPEQLLKAGDVVLCMSSGSKHLVGKAAPLAHDWNGSFGTFCGGLRFSARVNPGYGAYFFQSPSYREFIRAQSSGININNLRFADFEALCMPLPPLAEQERIVSRIEELFSDLDAGVAALEHVRAGLKRYKASVLKAAVEGRLLDGRVGRNAKGELPEGWRWAKVEDLNPPGRKCAYGVLQPGNDQEDGVLFVRVGDINDGTIDMRNLKRIDPQIAAQYPRTKLQGGEVLISLVGAIGRTAVVPQSLAGANTARAVGVIPVREEVHAPWVEVWFRNPEKIAEMTSKAHEVARKTLNLEDVRCAQVALPPLDEQRRIVEEVERRLSVVRQIEQAVEAGLARAARLRQAILKVAFQGRL